MALKGKSVLSIKSQYEDYHRYRFFQKEKFATYVKMFLALKTLLVEKVDFMTFTVIGNPPCL